MHVISMLAALALMQSEPEAIQTGGYTPNAQLLTSCKSKQREEWTMCWSFISGVVQASGMPGVTWPKGSINLPLDVQAWDVIPIVLTYIDTLPREAMSSPAVQSVYDALVAAHPQKAPVSDREK